ncbi:mechanosensitive ion channel family protein [Sphaerochaeta sp. PS]|uniref:mechanosensitive ion channel family protein n=1 Tax=Sphaerochaeta sp. PS TaxID=3076336 RepID=UPI0028A3AFD2|nr:mechanosensitive ion channel family protein [Sphaerochaeta sp. PS]MDT4763006.1 mechanosensitive ion channel family protein [Sphaerochaeta sp. PS]
MLSTIMALASEAATTAPQAAAESGSFFSQVVLNLHEWSQLGPVAFFLSLGGGLLIVLIGKLLIYWLSRILKRALGRSKKINDLMARFILQLTNILGWIFLIIAFLQHMGLNMGPVLAGLGITGVILGLAFQETIGNLLSGVMIVINAPFRIGDYIDAGSFSGTVTDMDMICVILSTPDNKKITMSNKLVWGSPIVNYSNMDRRRVDLLVSVAYGSDVATVKQVISSIFSRYEEILPEPAPVIEVSKLSASSIDFIARPWTKPQDYWKVNWRFQGEICSRLAEVGISVPFNQLDLHIIDAPKGLELSNKA